MRRISVLLFMLAPLFANGQQTAPVPVRVHAHGKLVKLFNGHDLAGFDTLLDKEGVNSDPRQVFQIAHGVVHISGDGFGGIVTQKEYENYYLRAEFKWGGPTYAPRKGMARDSGILYQITGPLHVWPTSIEFQITEGGTGDIWLVGGPDSAGPTMTVRGVTQTSTPADRYLKFDRIGKGPWKNIVGYRDPIGEVERPHGQWNTIELVADHDKVTYWVNGKMTNEGTGSSLTRGRILFQTEGAEVYFRKMKIAPLQ